MARDGHAEYYGGLKPNAERRRGNQLLALMRRAAPNFRPPCSAPTAWPC